VLVNVVDACRIVVVIHSRMTELEANVAIVSNRPHHFDEMSIIWRWSAEPEAMELDLSIIVTVELAAEMRVYLEIAYFKSRLAHPLLVIINHDG